jgi:hypothetical protein
MKSAAGITDTCPHQPLYAPLYTSFSYEEQLFLKTHQSTCVPMTNKPLIISNNRGIWMRVDVQTGVQTGTRFL